VAEALYVAVDGGGVEHNAMGDIAWGRPDSEGKTIPVAPGRELELRQPIALLDVFDELIFEAEPLGNSDQVEHGILRVSSARLVRPTKWSTETAAGFAISCTAHVLGKNADIPLPDGTTFEAVLSEARHDLAEVSDDHAEHLGNIHRLLELHRLNKQRAELGNMATALAGEYANSDKDALDDPAYVALEPLIDAVLAAIGALRHHAELRPLEAAEEQSQGRSERRLEASLSPLPIPTTVVTPFGATEVGGPHLPRHEPAWVDAREAARHARAVAADNGGDSTEASEREWQAILLSQVLKG
jgi:hypothetical protein